MNTEKQIAQMTAALAALGAEVTLLPPAEPVTYTAVIQPVRDRTRLYLEEQQNPFGGFARGYALYYGPAEGPGAALQMGSRLACTGNVYRVQRRELFSLRGCPAYIWALLAREEAEDGTEHSKGPADFTAAAAGTAETDS